MRIGIDIDDTTVITVNSMIKYADIFDKEVLGRSGSNNNLGLIKNRYYLDTLYGWDRDTKFKFFDTYYKNILEECVPKENAGKIIRELKNEGNEIYFITARLTSIPNCDAENITKNMLKENDIPYDKLIINASDKLKFCKENGIEVFIEDSYETCKELQENGIKAVLMTTKMNENVDAGNVERVDCWDEVYQKIKLLKGKIKNERTEKRFSNFTK